MPNRCHPASLNLRLLSQLGIIPEMLCKIRRIRPGEATHLRDIRLQALSESPAAFGGTFAADSERPSAYWEELATVWSEGDDGAAFVAEAEGAFVGMAVGVRRFDLVGFVAEPGSVHMGWMWVAPPARGAGLGLQLTNEVVAWAASTGALVVDLWVTRDNEAALSLYQRAGFSPAAERKPLSSDASHEIERMVLTLPGRTD
jgi:ribosomal protein S18 acetylase RimI-like enzyme